MAFAALFTGATVPHSVSRTAATLAGAELSAFPPDATRSLGAAFIGATPNPTLVTDDAGRSGGGAFIGASLAGAVPALAL